MHDSLPLGDTNFHRIDSCREFSNELKCLPLVQLSNREVESHISLKIRPFVVQIDSKRKNSIVDKKIP